MDLDSHATSHTYLDFSRVGMKMLDVTHSGCSIAVALVGPLCPATWLGGLDALQYLARHLGGTFIHRGRPLSSAYSSSVRKLTPTCPTLSAFPSFLPASPGSPVACPEGRWYAGRKEMSGTVLPFLYEWYRRSSPTFHGRIHSISLRGASRPQGLCGKIFQQVL